LKINNSAITEQYDTRKKCKNPLIFRRRNLYTFQHSKSLLGNIMKIQRDNCQVTYTIDESKIPLFIKK